MRYILIIAVLFFTISCAVQNTLLKTYSDKNSENTFMFSSDSTFEYRYRYSHLQEYSKGTYKKDMQGVILNSAIQDRVPEIEVKEFNNNNETLSVSLKGTASKSEYKCEIFINDTLYKLVNQHQLLTTGLTYQQAEKEVNVSDLYFRYVRADSLTELQLLSEVKSIMLKIVKLPSSTSTAIYPYTINTLRYVVKSIGSKKIEMNIPINDSMFNYKIFSDEKIKIKQNAISIYNANINKWVRMPAKE